MTPWVNNIDINNVMTKDVICNAEIEDDLGILTIHIGMTQITIYTNKDNVAGIRRILGGW
jgi:hypothetical protein